MWTWSEVKSKVEIATYLEVLKTNQPQYIATARSMQRRLERGWYRCWLGTSDRGEQCVFSVRQVGDEVPVIREIGLAGGQLARAPEAVYDCMIVQGYKRWFIDPISKSAGRVLADATSRLAGCRDRAPAAADAHSFEFEVDDV